MTINVEQLVKDFGIAIKDVSAASAQKVLIRVIEDLAVQANIEGGTLPLVAPTSPEFVEDDDLTAAPEWSMIRSSEATAGALPDGTVVGQRKWISFFIDNGDYVITPDNFVDGTTITFTGVGQVVGLEWTASGWKTIARYNTDPAAASTFATIA